MSSDDEIIDELVALGIIVLIGAGIYGIIRSFGSFEDGDEATKKQVLKMRHNQSSSVEIEQNEGETDICEVCGTISPERCYGAGHCMVCVERETYDDGKCFSCHRCLKCEGHAQSGLCRQCDD